MAAISPPAGTVWRTCYSGPAMALDDPNDSTRVSLAWARRKWPVRVKAITFALIGVVNTVVDYSIFLLARAMLDRSTAALSLFDALAHRFRFASAAAILLMASNLISWSIAISGSYIMNSSITFAAESGRKLRLNHYIVFVCSGVVGLAANTATLLFTAQILLLPVWLAKACAVLASFVVNFSLSHFVVFRARGAPEIKSRET
jgi:putative flippase GtrA